MGGLRGMSQEGRVPCSTGSSPKGLRQRASGLGVQGGERAGPAAVLACSSSRGLWARQLPPRLLTF